MKFSFFYYLFFILLFLLPLSSAVGVSPPYYKINFEPNFEETYTFTVRNNVGHDIIVTANPSGNLAEYATVIGNDFPLRANERGDFQVQLSLPNYIDSPGRNQLKIYVTEKSSGGGISAKAGVIPIIFIQVPYPGHYAIIESFQVAKGTGGVNEGEDTPIDFTIWNQGLEKLSGTHAELILSTLDGEILETREFSPANMEPNARYTQSIDLATANLPPSDYAVALNYYYDDIVRSKDSLLRVGNFDVKLTNSSSSVEKKGIVPFTLEVENRWKGKVFVTSTLSIPGAAPMETPRKGLNYFQKAKLTAYLDTTNLLLGNHTGEVTLFFEKDSPLEGDEPQTKIVPVQFELIEPIVPEKERPEFSINSTTLMISIMIILVIIAVALVIVLVRKKKD